MKPLLLILALAFPVLAQDIKQIEQIKDWKLIKEMSGDVPNHPGITIEMYAARIARGGDRIRLAVRIDYPGGAPWDLYRENAPFGFDISSITRAIGQVELNCSTLIAKAVGDSAYIYQFNGKRYKSKEYPVELGQGSAFARYFCERGPSPTTAPTLKRKGR